MRGERLGPRARKWVRYLRCHKQQAEDAVSAAVTLCPTSGFEPKHRMLAKAQKKETNKQILLIASRIRVYLKSVLMLHGVHGPMRWCLPSRKRHGMNMCFDFAMSDNLREAMYHDTLNKRNHRPKVTKKKQVSLEQTTIIQLHSVETIVQVRKHMKD